MTTMYSVLPHPPLYDCPFAEGRNWWNITTQRIRYDGTPGEIYYYVSEDHPANSGEETCRDLALQVAAVQLNMSYMTHVFVSLVLFVDGQPDRVSSFDIYLLNGELQIQQELWS